MTKIFSSPKNSNICKLIDPEPHMFRKVGVEVNVQGFAAIAAEVHNVFMWASGKI